MLRCTMAEGSEHEDLEIDADCEETHAINLSFVVSKCSRAPRTCLSCGKPLQKIGHARKNGAKRNVIFSAHRSSRDAGTGVLQSSPGPAQTRPDES